MKTSKTFGIIGASLALVGGLFKLQHWPGASIMLTVGIALAIVFLFYWFINSYKDITNSKEKTALVTLFILLFLAAITSLFKIQHWPFGGVLLMADAALTVLVFIPVYLIYLSSERDENKKNIRFAFFIFYLTTTGIFLARGGSSAFVLNAFAYPDQSLSAMTENISKNNVFLYEKAYADTLIRKRTTKVKESSDNLIKYISQLKIHLLKETEPDLKTMPDAAISIVNVQAKDNFDIPTFLLLGFDSEKPRQGANSATELKNKIIAYREGLLNVIGGVVKFDIGLKTEPVKANDIIESWEIGNFYRTPIAAVIIILDQLQNEVRYAESLALTQ